MRIYISLVIAALLAFVIAAQDRDTSDLNNKRQNADIKKDEIKDEINKVKREQNSVKKDIRSVDRDLTRVNRALDNTVDELESSVERRDTLETELKLANEFMVERQIMVEDRLRQMYQQSEHSVLTVLVGADSIGDLANRKALLERIAKRDRDLFESFKKLKEEISQNKAEEEDVIRSISRLKNKQESTQDELEDVQGQKRKVLRDLDKEKKQLEKEFAAWDRQSKILQAQLDEHQRGMEGTESALAFSGKMIKPSNGSYGSPFGMRYHPIRKRQKMHNGVDIRATNRSQISAAASGVVFSSGWISGYGNTVVIDHGSGISTLYAHASALYVKKGQRVVAGDRIAAVGTTGLSTGPHLHFEVRKNGKPVNPRPYLP